MRIKRADLRQNGPPPTGTLAGKCAEEDYNSNSDGSGRLQAALELEALHDNDYLWFLDYNPLFRDGSCQHVSVLSSVRSYGAGGVEEIACRLQLARDLDANLAQADMESFRTEDIHALLLTDNCLGAQDESAANSISTMSLCKSELLFSPVKEAAQHAVHFSVDSLDCELPSERELILTCRANKDNYTIAFEGSLCEDEASELLDNAVSRLHDDNMQYEEMDERTRKNLEILDRCHQLTNKLTSSMARSEQGLTTWSKLRKQTGQSPLRRHGSGNNNEGSGTADACSSVIKSQSLPDLFRSRKLANSVHSAAMSNSTIDSFTHITNQRLSGAGACMKVYDVTNAITRSNGSQHSDPMSTSSNENQSSSDKSQAKQPFNLVKLFMKQKSMSNEGIVSMEQLGSECWPSSSGGESDSFGDSKTKLVRKMEKLPKMSISDSSTHDEPDCCNPSPIYETMNTTQTLTCNKIYDNALIEEEESDSGKIEPVNRVLSDSESNLYATVNKPQRRNLNNNNSPLRMRSTNKRSCSSHSSATSFSISSCSESDATQLTKMHRLINKDHSDNRAISTQVQVETIDRSMQTSSIAPSYIQPERDFIKVVEPSFLKKLKEGDCEKPVFVLYPNYTLPDISFLNGRPNIYLNPQKITLANESKKKTEVKGKRPFSCNDLEMLRKKGFSHIRDWDSLNFLLPMECRQLLSEIPEVMNKISKESLQSKEKYSLTPKNKCRPMSCDCTHLGNHATNVSSSSSTATQPSSGYRGSSTMLTDSSAQNSPTPANMNPLFVYRYDSTSSETSFDKSNPTAHRRSLGSAEKLKSHEIAPPRPPLPKGILRKSLEKTRKTATKRYSMFEMEEQINEITCMNAVTEQKLTKRRSLQEPYYLQKQNSLEKRKNNDLAAKRLSQQFLDAADKDADCHEYDEGVGTESSLESGKSHEIKYRSHTPPLPKPRNKHLEYIDFPPASALISSAELQQLEEFLTQSGFSCDNMEKWDKNQVQKVRKQVNKFFNMKRSQEKDAIEKFDRKSLTFNKGEKKAELKPVEELKEGITTPPNSPNISVLAQRNYQAKNLSEMPIREEGESTPEEQASPRRDPLGRGTVDIAQKRALVSSVTDAVELLINHFAPAADQSELSRLGDSDQSPACARAALHALCPALYAVFSDGLKESIETSFGAVNNSVWQMVESTARQGPITRSLHELVLRINSEDAVSEGLVKYNAFVLGLLNAKSVDAWVTYIRTRESDLRKHYAPNSLLRLDGSGDPACRRLLDTLLASLQPLKLLPFRLDIMFEMRELHRSFKRLESEVRAATRLEWAGAEGAGATSPAQPPATPSNGGKFRKLQLKWELLSNTESPPATPPGCTEATPAARGSRIPRPVTSPVRPAPPRASPQKHTTRGIPVAVRKTSSPTTPVAPPLRPTGAHPKRQSLPSRTSRIEQPTGATPRPSSLPYNRPPAPRHARRAASSSLNRNEKSPVANRAPGSAGNKTKQRMVRTLWHRLPSDSGHLAFNEGERLRLVLEVDEHWLLCCRGEQKGLVPREAVILEHSLDRL